MTSDKAVTHLGVDVHFYQDNAPADDCNIPKKIHYSFPQVFRLGRCEVVKRVL